MTTTRRDSFFMDARSYALFCPCESTFSEDPSPKDQVVTVKAATHACASALPKYTHVTASM